MKRTLLFLLTVLYFQFPFKVQAQLMETVKLAFQSVFENNQLRNELQAFLGSPAEMDSMKLDYQLAEIRSRIASQAAELCGVPGAHILCVIYLSLPSGQYLVIEDPALELSPLIPPHIEEAFQGISSCKPGDYWESLKPTATYRRYEEVTSTPVRIFMELLYCPD